MSAFFDRNLHMVRSSPAILASLSSLQRGIEKESLRVNPDGTLALTPHPTGLGSALCHPKITTDYSESLLELITPVHHTVRGCIQDLEDIHRFVYEELNKQNEMLWTSSMPCQLGKAEEIPIAQYGISNVAKMKTLYRLGLGHRYGRAMQAIAGIHYNFSLSDKFWTHYKAARPNNQSLAEFKTEQYFGLIRNFRRFVPLLIYLFGASPAICRSFLQGQRHNLSPFDGHSWYREYATSLRMGDLGYQSSVQESLFVCYNSLDEYIKSLRKAIATPHPHYAAIGLKDEKGQYKQLSTSVLQIENEFYSPVRPKRIAASGEAPINALARGGVEYIEVRCLDINPFTSTGIDSETMHFLDLFLVYCLLEESPAFTKVDCEEIILNLKQIVSNGRSRDCAISLSGQSAPFRQWGSTMLNNMQPLAATLDSLHSTNAFQASLSDQLAKVENPDLTPSARIIADMREKQITFAEFARRQSDHWNTCFANNRLPASERLYFNELAADSLVQQRTIEKADSIPFEQYLQDFYRQYSEFGHQS